MKRYFFCVKIIFLIVAAQNIKAAEFVARESENLIQLRDVENSLQASSAATTKVAAQQIATRAHEEVQQANQEAIGNINEWRNRVANLIERNKDNPRLIQAALVLLEIEEDLLPLTSLQKRLAVLQNSSNRKDVKSAEIIKGELRSKNIQLNDKINVLKKREELAQNPFGQAVESRPIPAAQEELPVVQAVRRPVVDQPVQSASLVKQLLIPASIESPAKARAFIAKTAEQFEALQNAGQQLQALQKRLADVQKFKALPKGSADGVNMMRANPDLAGDLLDSESLQKQIDTVQQDIEALKKDVVEGAQEHRNIWQFIKDVLEKDAAASEMSPQQLTKVLAIMGGLLAIPIIAVVIVGILEGTGVISFNRPGGDRSMPNPISMTKSAYANFTLILNSPSPRNDEFWNISSVSPLSSSLLVLVGKPASGLGSHLGGIKTTFTFKPLGKPGVAKIQFTCVNIHTKQVVEIKIYEITLV